MIGTCSMALLHCRALSPATVQKDVMASLINDFGEHLIAFSSLAAKMFEYERAGGCGRDREAFDPDRCDETISQKEVVQ